MASPSAIRLPTIVLIVALMALGLLALSKLKVNQTPDVDVPVISVNIPYPGASPESVEREIITRIEKSLQSLPGVDHVYAEAIEARGRIIGAVTAKQVRLYGTAYVDGDITHEQLAMETGAFFQGRSLKFQRPATPPAPAPSPLAQASAPAPTPGLAPKPV